MHIRTTKDIGAVIRHWRKIRGLDQGELAEKVGVSRRWVVQIEQGKPRAAQNLVLKTLDVLGVTVSVSESEKGTPTTKNKIESVNIDSIIEKAKGRK